MYISKTPYIVGGCIPPACTGGLNMEHVGRKIWKMPENGRKCAHSWRGQIGYMSDLDCGVPQNWNQILHVQQIFWTLTEPPSISGMAGSPSEPLISDRPKLPTGWPWCAKPKRVYRLGPRNIGHQSMYLQKF